MRVTYKIINEVFDIVEYPYRYGMRFKSQNISIVKCGIDSFFFDLGIWNYILQLAKRVYMKNQI